MMRLIDADALTDWMIDELRKLQLKQTAGLFDTMNGRQAANTIGTHIDEMPTVSDVVPGVYCKDCKHLDKASRFCFICMDWVKDTWFCRVGERRENNETD